MSAVCLGIGWVLLSFAATTIILHMVDKSLVTVEHPLVLIAILGVAALFFIAAK